MLNWSLCSTLLLAASCVLCFDAVCLVAVNWHLSCDCCAGWTGDYCDTNIDECALSVNNSEPICLHGGVCSDTLGSYTCLCDNTGYTGMSSCCWLCWRSKLQASLTRKYGLSWYDAGPSTSSSAWRTSTLCTSYVVSHRVKAGTVGGHHRNRCQYYYYTTVHSFSIPAVQKLSSSSSSSFTLVSASVGVWCIFYLFFMWSFLVQSG